jgi:hypothetical protein
MMYKDKDKQREANRQAKARQRAYKGLAKDVQGMTQTENVIPKTDTHVIPKQGCKYCGKELEFAVLECCYDCALKQPTKVSPAKDGHILSSRPALEFTGKLTDYEREHYKPASQLSPGQYNPVSKPGDEHYA